MFEAVRDAAEHDLLTAIGERVSGMDDALLGLERDPAATGLLDDVFRDIHVIKGSAGFLGQDAMHELCNLSEGILESARAQRQIDGGKIDLLLRAAAHVKLMASALLSGMRPPAPPADLAEALRGAAVGYRSSPLPLRTDDAGPRVPPREPRVRVESGRLDHIMGLAVQVGAEASRFARRFSECAEAEAQTHQMPVASMARLAVRLESLAADLRTSVQQVRMQPMSDLFQHYPRLVRDLCRRLGKDVDLQIRCGEAEIDRALIEELRDPLMQLVRNAIDHGVEDAAGRVVAGKPRSGLLRLSAVQAGDRVVIEVVDDGRGICPDEIRRKAIERGLLTPEAAGEIDDKMALSLIFQAGLSTKEAVSEISGRGVGMDVVRASVERLSGRLEVGSRVGEGAVFRVELPLPVAVIPALIVSAGWKTFAVPVAAVREVVTLPCECGLAMRSLSTPAEPVCGVVVNTSGGVSFVLGIDDVRGQEDVLLRAADGGDLESVIVGSRCGDGSPVLVIDVDAMAKHLPLL